MSRDKREHLISVLKDFDTAMLFTRNGEGALHGRPMNLARVSDDGSIIFATSKSSGVIEEVKNDPQTGVAVQGKMKFATLSGTARERSERPLIHALWKEDWKLWWPEGKDDPNITLVEFDATRGEYWDNSGTKGVQFVINAAKAYFSGEQIEEGGPEQNAKVRL